MDKQPSASTLNGTTAAVLTALEHTIGKESRSWQKWWEKAGRDLEGIGIALYAALLSLGAPPHPNMMTKDQWDIAVASLPDPTTPGLTPHARHVFEMRRNRELNRLDIMWRRQHYYNKRLNKWAARHGFVYAHKTHDPAQFRKLFSAFVLHACKGPSEGRDDAHLG